MDDRLKQIANSVAKALGLDLVTDNEPYPFEIPPYYKDESMSLLADGSNLFTPYWRCQCMDWLLERGTLYFCGDFAMRVSPGAGQIFYPNESSQKMLLLKCPAAEFPARAIHELLKAPK